jgi:hypothetical protein
MVTYIVTLHYLTLHYPTLHYITLPDVPLYLLNSDVRHLSGQTACKRHSLESNTQTCSLTTTSRHGIFPFAPACNGVGDATEKEPQTQGPSFRRNFPGAGVRSSPSHFLLR